MYKLLIEDDEGGQTAVSLIRDEITIGRKEGNTIRLTDRNVSRRHGRIVREDDRIYVEDVAARYGIKKNGDRIDERAELEEGDVVLIGDYRLTLKLDSKAKKKKEKKKAKEKPSLPEPPEGSEAAGDFGEDDREQTQVIQTLPAKLVVISSNFAGEEFPLTKDEMIIGRGEQCNIIIDHRSVSGKHAKVVREDAQTFKIVDLNSSNGVKVNGDQYRALHLKRGDVVELGHVKFRFVEPGENYVFTPQDQVDAMAPEIDSGPDLLKLGLLGGGVVAVMVVLAGVVVILSGSDDNGVDPGDQQAAAERLEEELDLEVEEGDDEVQVYIDNAREQIVAGNLREPVGQLEMVREAFEPTSEQRQEIEDLVAKARHERSNKQHYEQAIDELEAGEPLAAFNEMSAIPPGTIFRDLMHEDGTADEIFEAVLAEGYEAVADEDLELARQVAAELEVVDYGPVAELVAEIEDTEAALEEAAQAAREAEATQVAAAQQGGTGGTGGQAGGGAPAQDTSPAPSPGLSAEEAREKYTEAGRHLTGGSPQDAISTCQEALDAGYTACHRIMGLAYTRLDDTASACRHFQQYLNIGPDNPGPIENQMENLGCD